MRTPAAPYVDPLEHVWLAAARRIGLRVTRSRDVYASTNGRGELAIGAGADLDADDSLAQMILHELCHSLVEGPESLERPDWGLDNETTRDVPREHACLRLQAALVAPFGLRTFLAPTTEYRAFYDALGEDPLAPADDPTSVLARAGLARAARPPWAPALADALATTASIAHAARLAGDSATLYQTVEPAWPAHPAGFAVPPYLGDATCETCAWRYDGGRGRPVPRCRQANGARVDPGWPACERWEPDLDCLACGACCREAYDTVELSPREPIAAARPDLIVEANGRLQLARADTRCAALAAAPPYRCDAYDLRPSTCRDFERRGPHCLTARRRVGLSR